MTSRDDFNEARKTGELESNLKESALAISLIAIISLLSLGTLAVTSVQSELSASGNSRFGFTAKPGFCKRNKDLCQAVKDTFQKIKPGHSNDS